MFSAKWRLPSVSLINTLGLLPSPNLERHSKILVHSGFSGHLRSIAILRSILSCSDTEDYMLLSLPALTAAVPHLFALTKKRDRLQYSESAEAAFTYNKERSPVSPSSHHWFLWWLCANGFLACLCVISLNFWLLNRLHTAWLTWLWLCSG